MYQSNCATNVYQSSNVSSLKSPLPSSKEGYRDDICPRFWSDNGYVRMGLEVLVKVKVDVSSDQWQSVHGHTFGKWQWLLRTKNGVK